MAEFIQCPVCAAEYGDPSDRRYFSQTNSCPTCGIQLGWFDCNGEGGYSVDSKVILNQAKDALHAGKILAVKGIGGFLLLVDARNAQALARLRERKHRPSKPFALLYPDLHTLEQDVELHAAAKVALLGTVAPIVLAPLRQSPSAGVVFEGVAPGLNHAGVMLPYAPLLELLMQAFPHPVVATSGNLSNAPIVFEAEKALSELTAVADYIVTHNRAIATPQDDSVLRFSPISNVPIWLRRSRGLAPTLVLEAASEWSRPALAMGADMKSAFTLFYSGNTYVSQYLGELDNWDTQRHFELVLNHLLTLFQAYPQAILTDLHPGYYSSALGHSVAEKQGLPVYSFQHHAAHFGAVLAEHSMFDSAEPMLGVILDGTGMGTDGQIWGGEFFRYQAREMKRIAHLSYFPHLAGDKMAKEPRISALALCSEIPEAASLLKPWFDNTEWLIYNTLATKPGALKTSSTGRLLDGIAALCGLSQRTSYEGEAAMQLEELAYHYFVQKAWKKEAGYFCHCTNGEISVPSLLKNVLADIDRGVAPAQIAAYVHLWLVNSVEYIAETAGIKRLAFSGGVLQNAVLVELLMQRLGGQYQLFFHRELSPNDENISLGQLALYEENIRLVGMG